MFEDACRMPLAIRWKGVVKGGRTVDDFISFADFAPTFLEAAGLKPHAQMSGRSFTMSSRQRPPGRSIHPAGT